MIAVCSNLDRHVQMKVAERGKEENHALSVGFPNGGVDIPVEVSNANPGGVRLVSGK